MTKPFKFPKEMFKSEHFQPNTIQQDEWVNDEIKKKYEEYRKKAIKRLKELKK